MTPPVKECQQRVLIVDDEPSNLKAMQQALQDDYQLLFATNGEQAVDVATKQKPDLILLDVIMPDMDGFEVCKLLKADPNVAAIPVIFVTVRNETQDEEAGFAVGAVDYMSKPIRPPIVRARVKTHLSLVKIDELKEAKLQVVQRLSRAAEFKDCETSGHILRMSHYTRLIALAYGCPHHWAEDLLHAAPMHDVGKIGIPDTILNKTGPLDDKEMEVMRQHPLMGASIIGLHANRMLRMARNVALHHHEKWDGTGYPNQLSGEDITLEARITAIADVFDALTTVRPYKEAWPITKAIDYIVNQSGKHFEPALVEAFEKCLPQIKEVYTRWKDSS